jgi:precorrin-2 dehydrogenase/sirohydrochlorin ferrochelatase
VVLDGKAFSAVVIGGGSVATRKTRALLEGEVSVTVVALELSAELEALEKAGRITCMRRGYVGKDLDLGDLVIVATNDPQLNAAIVSRARSCGKLVNATDDAANGNFMTPAVHRAGDLSIAVSANGVPSAAAAVRDELAGRFDERYAAAIAGLRQLRSSMLADGRADEWREIAGRIRLDFCAQVESNSVEGGVPTWR